MTESVKKILTQLRDSLRDMYGDRLVKLVLFGSVARGDDAEGSDIDILVVLKGDVNPGEEIRRTGHVASEISLMHDVVISFAFISQERYESEQSPLLLNVRREGIPA